MAEWEPVGMGMSHVGFGRERGSERGREEERERERLHENLT